MSQQSRATLKAYFETGDKPTQAQFEHLIDSMTNITDDTPRSGSFSGSFSGSHSGSFYGDGSGLTGVTAEWDGTHNGNAEISGSLIVSGSVLYVRGDQQITGSLRASGSVILDRATAFDGKGEIDLMLGGNQGQVALTTDTNKSAFGGTAGLVADSGSKYVKIYGDLTHVIEVDAGNGLMAIRVPGVGIEMYSGSGEITPATGNTYKLGSDSVKWKSIHALSFTGSSFTGSFKGDGSDLTGIVSSAWTASGDGISRFSNVTITGSFKVTGSVVDFTLVPAISGSSFSGSFAGDGTSLNNVSVIYANVTNKPLLLSGSAQISTEISGAFNSVSASLASRITTEETKTSYSGSFSGSFQGDGSQLTNIGKFVYRNIFIDAGAMVPRITNGAGGATEEYATNDIMSEHLLFDSGSEEGVQFRLMMPDEWNLGTVKAKVFWDASTGANNGDQVSWALRAGAISDSQSIDSALGTSVVINDIVTAIGNLHISPASDALTIGGAPALGDMIIFQIVRNVSGSDNMNVDAKLLGAAIQYTENSSSNSQW